MIEKIEVYIVKCKCGEKLDAHGDGGYTVYEEKENAIKSIDNEEWEMKGDEVLCGYCIDERDRKK